MNYKVTLFALVGVCFIASATAQNVPGANTDCPVGCQVYAATPAKVAADTDVCNTAKTMCFLGCKSGFYAVNKLTVADWYVESPVTAAIAGGVQAIPAVTCKPCANICSGECLDAVITGTSDVRCRNTVAGKATCPAGKGVDTKSTSPAPPTDLAMVPIATVGTANVWLCGACSVTGCVDCTLDKTKCNTCNSTGYYLNGTAGTVDTKCTDCPKGCAKCTSGTACTTCTNSSLTAHKTTGVCYSQKIGASITLAVFISSILSMFLF